jgi:Flp pilus assembly protein TadB
VFAAGAAGNPRGVIGLALALVVLGVIFLFLIPWVGVPIGIVGLVLLVVWLLGFGRRTGEPQP